MKKKKVAFLGNTVLAAAISLAGITGAAQVAQSAPTHQAEQTNRDIKSTPAKTNSRQYAVTKTVGGLDLVHVFTRDTNTPYMYAIQHGAKKHGKKNNFKKLSHQYKVKRRAK